MRVVGSAGFLVERILVFLLFLADGVAATVDLGFAFGFGFGAVSSTSGTVAFVLGGFLTGGLGLGDGHGGKQRCLGVNEVATG